MLAFWVQFPRLSREFHTKFCIMAISTPNLHSVIAMAVMERSTYQCSPATATSKPMGWDCFRTDRTVANLLHSSCINVSQKTSFKFDVSSYVCEMSRLCLNSRSVCIVNLLLQAVFGNSSRLRVDSPSREHLAGQKSPTRESAPRYQSVQRTVSVASFPLAERFPNGKVRLPSLPPTQPTQPAMASLGNRYRD